MFWKDVQDEAELLSFVSAFHYLKCVLDIAGMLLLEKLEIFISWSGQNGIQYLS